MLCVCLLIFIDVSNVNVVNNKFDTKESYDIMTQFQDIDLRGKLPSDPNPSTNPNTNPNRGTIFRAIVWAPYFTE